MWYGWRSGWLQSSGDEAKQDNGKVSEIELTKSLPEGWPQGLPVDMERLVEEKRVEYRNATLYSIVYVSPEQLESIFANYEQHFKKNGYALTAVSKTQQHMTLTGTKGSTEVTVLITPSEGGNNVNLAVVNRI